MELQAQASEVEELERAKRDLEDFIYMTSHDLKAPLLTIQGFCTILEEDYADKLDETGRKYLELMKKAAERMTALIVDLLNVSRVGREFIAVETIDLNELLEEKKSDLRE